MHLTEMFLAIAVLGFLAGVFGHIAEQLLTPYLCRALGHRSLDLGTHKFCHRCGRHV